MDLDLITGLSFLGEASDVFQVVVVGVRVVVGFALWAWAALLGLGLICLS